MAVEFDFKGLEGAFEADWPVAVDVPQNGGTIEQQTFMARFRLVPEDELEALKTKEREDLGGDRKQAEHLYIRAFFVGFAAEQDLGDRSGDELMELLLGRRWVRLGLLRAYNAFQAGIAVKN